MAVRKGATEFKYTREFLDRHPVGAVLVVVPVDLLVAESRKGASEAMGAMLVGRIIADHPQPLVKRIIRERLIKSAHEKM
jgi:hypothetical protein